MHGAYECQPFQRPNGVQPIAVMVCQDVSNGLGQANRKKPVPVVLIPFDDCLVIIEFKDWRLF